MTLLDHDCSKCSRRAGVSVRRECVSNFNVLFATSNEQIATSGSSVLLATCFTIFFVAAKLRHSRDMSLFQSYGFENN